VCLNWGADRRKQAKDNGWCVNHPDRSAVSGSFCPECVGRNAANSRATYWRAKDNHRCPNCGEPTEFNPKTNRWNTCCIKHINFDFFLYDNKNTEWERQHYLARKVWTATYGPIPPGFDVHHRSGNWRDSSIENLWCLPMWHHRDIHKERGDVGWIRVQERLNKFDMFRDTAPQDYIPRVLPDGSIMIVGGGK
jgi:hypothetical protein